MASTISTSSVRTIIFGPSVNEFNGITYNIFTNDRGDNGSTRNCLVSGFILLFITFSLPSMLVRFVIDVENVDFSLTSTITCGPEYSGSHSK